jgi:hypothetical protein
VHGVVGNSFYYPAVTRDFILDTSRQDDLALAERVRGETYEAGAGTFRQRLTVVRRRADPFAVHGERVAGAI